MGTPWWDYWIPLIAMQKGLTIKIVQNADIYHVNHAINYDYDLWRTKGISFVREFLPSRENYFQSLLSSDLKQLDSELISLVVKNFFLLLENESILLNC